MVDKIKTGNEQIFTDWVSDLPVNFHWNNQLNLTNLQ